MYRKAVLIVLCALMSPVGLAHAGDLSADEVLAKNAEARGGLEAIRSVKSMSFSGSMAMMGMEAPFSMEFLRPNAVRMDFTIQGVTGTRAYDGETGWEIMPFMGKTEPSLVSADDLKELADQADFDGAFVDYKDKGHSVELVGKVEADGTEAYQIKLTKKSGDVEDHFFDTEYFLEFKLEGKRMMQGAETEYTTVIGDYKEVGGLMVPHSIESSFGENFTQTITITEVKLNVDINPDRFKMPEAKKAEKETSGSD